MQSRRSGMTKIEAIIWLLLILFGGYLVLETLVVSPRTPAAYFDQRDYLRHLCTACRTLETDFGRLPPAWGEYGRLPKGSNVPRTANPFVHVLPLLDRQALFDQGDFKDATIPTFLPGLDPSLKEGSPAGLTSYVANLRVFSDFGADVKWNEPITDLEKCRATAHHTDKLWDGAINTVLFTTKYAVCNGVHNRFYLPPWHGSSGGPFFGAGSHAGGPIPTSHIPTGPLRQLPSYQIAPSLDAEGRNVCNNARGVFGHSLSKYGLAVGMADGSSRNLSFQVSGDTFAKSICPNDGQHLGADW